MDFVDRVQRDDLIQQASGRGGLRVVHGKLAGEAAAKEAIAHTNLLVSVLNSIMHSRPSSALHWG